MDGGPFVTMPQVYTEDIDKPGVMNSNLGMYRIQLAGNDYITDKEIGLHYQLLSNGVLSVCPCHKGTNENEDLYFIRYTVCTSFIVNIIFGKVTDYAVLYLFS